jgi:hypothetical protein
LYSAQELWYPDLSCTAHKGTDVNTHLELKPSGGEPAQLPRLLQQLPDLDSLDPVPDDPTTEGADERR